MYSKQTEMMGLPQYGLDEIQRVDLNKAFLTLDDEMKKRPAADAQGKYPAAAVADGAGYPERRPVGPACDGGGDGAVTQGGSGRGRGS